MANAQQPYFENGKWWMDVDPDDQNYIVADVTKDLTDRATAATSVTTVVAGVTVLEDAVVQGSLMVAKVTIDIEANVAAPVCTFRVTCANTERFDRTVWFKLEDH
jgi:hypothetical protein